MQTLVGLPLLHTLGDNCKAGEPFNMNLYVFIPDGVALL
jgi:hypothetical protein